MAKKVILRLMVVVVLFGVLAEQSNAAAINIALNKPASTNKSIWSDYWPSKAVDGDIETIWSADHHGNPADPTWLKVDLEDVFAVKQIVLKVRTWQTKHAGYYVDYVLYSSEDGQAWEEIGQGQLIDFDNPIDTIELNGKSMRYLRYDVVGGTHWAHLHEMEVYVYAELTNLEIVGSDEVAESSQTQYRVLAHFDNDSTVDVTDSANWSVEPNEYSNINSSGLLTTQQIHDVEENITITAQYTSEDTTFSDQKPVSIFSICPSGYALQFDGQDDYAELPASVIIPNANSKSIALWFKINNFQRWDRLFMWWDGTNKVVVALGDYEGQISGTLNNDNDAFDIKSSVYSVGEWHHLCYTFDGITTTAYIDGIKPVMKFQGWLGANNHGVYIPLPIVKTKNRGF